MFKVVLWDVINVWEEIEGNYSIFQEISLLDVNTVWYHKPRERNNNKMNRKNKNNNKMKKLFKNKNYSQILWNRFMLANYKLSMKVSLRL